MRKETEKNGIFLLHIPGRHTIFKKQSTRASAVLTNAAALSRDFADNT